MINLETLQGKGLVNLTLRGKNSPGKCEVCVCFKESFRRISKNNLASSKDPSRLKTTFKDSLGGISESKSGSQETPWKRSQSNFSNTVHAEGVLLCDAKGRVSAFSYKHLLSAFYGPF